MPLALVPHAGSFAAPVLRSEPTSVRGVATHSARATPTILAANLLPASVIVRALLFVASSSVQESTLQPQTALVSPTCLQLALASSRPVSMKPAFRNFEKPRSLPHQPLQISLAEHSKAESLPISFCHAFSWQLRDRQYPPNRDRP